jgi:hypothetical protein
VVALAEQIVGTETRPHRQAALIEQYLLRNFKYVANPADLGKPMSVDDFLLRGRKGDCQYFAAGMVALLSTLDVPARIAGGFYGGRLNPLTGYYAIRREDAHAWTEVWDGAHWKTFDATPADLRPGAGQLNPVRVFIDVPQSVAPSVVVGTDAAITVREYAGRTFAGKVTRAAGALDPELHVMSTEIQVPNNDNALLPGMYVQVALTLAVPHKVLEIPSTALYSDAEGLRVATVDAQQKIKLVPITIERDTGQTLWIATGLTGDERILKIAVPSLVDGDAVEIAAPAPAAQAQKSSP